MMSWDKLWGQDVARRILQNQVQKGQISHAYLFMGPPQTGKIDAALILAQAVNCQSPTRPCGSCLSCRQTELAAHPDVRHVVPDGNSIKLQQIKDMLTEAVLTPNVGPYRVFIIESADNLTPEAANALLLMLEEPPRFDIFILTAAGPVLSTIQSRCQVIRFVRRPGRRHALPSSAVAPAAEEGGDTLRQQALRLVQELAETPPMERAQLVAQLDKVDIDLEGLLAALLSLYRDLHVWQLTGQIDLLEDPDAAQQIYADNIQPDGFWAKGCQAILTTQRRLSNNINRKLALEYLLYSL